MKFPLTMPAPAQVCPMHCLIIQPVSYLHLHPLPHGRYLRRELHGHANARPEVLAGKLHSVDNHLSTSSVAICNSSLGKELGRQIAGRGILALWNGERNATCGPKVSWDAEGILITVILITVDNNV